MRRQSIEADLLCSTRFKNLDVEDLSDEDPKTAANASSTSARAKPNHNDGVYELADDDYQDFDFALFCFFEDLHTIQDKIHECWKHFFAGSISLDVATVVTQAGVDAVKRLEKEVYAQRSCDEHFTDSYTELSFPVFFADALFRGKDPHELLQSPENLEHREFHDFIFLPT